MSIARTLANYLDEHLIQYDLISHPHTQSSMDTAASAHVPQLRNYGDTLPFTLI